MLDHFDTEEGYLEFAWGDEDYVIIHKKKWQPKAAAEDAVGTRVTMTFAISSITEMHYKAPFLFRSGVVEFIIKGKRYKDSFGDEEGSTLCTIRRGEWARLMRILKTIDRRPDTYLIKGIKSKDRRGYTLGLALREDLEK